MSVAEEQGLHVPAEEMIVEVVDYYYEEWGTSMMMRISKAACPVMLGNGCCSDSDRFSQSLPSVLEWQRSPRTAMDGPEPQIRAANRASPKTFVSVYKCARGHQSQRTTAEKKT